MPLSFSNIKKAAGNIAQGALGLVAPGLVTAGKVASSAASNALQNKMNAPSSVKPVVASSYATPAGPVQPKTTAIQASPAKITSTPTPISKPVTTSSYGASTPTAANVVNSQQTSPSPYQTQTQQQNVVQPPNYQGIIMDLMNKAKEGEDVKKAREDLTRFQGILANKIADIRSDDIPLEFQQGRAQVVQQAGAEREAALQTGVSNALAQQQQELNALQAAAGFAQPVQVPYGSQYINPLTGEAVNPAMSGDLQNQVGNIVQRIQSGTLSYDQGVQALSGYGQAGVNALQQALPQGFNIAQSNALAGQQGTVGVNYQLAETALGNVENIINTLSKLQKTNIPAVNKVSNWLSREFGVGSKETREMAGAVQSLRNAYTALLASVKGGTPTDYTNQALAEIPDEPTPNDIAAVRANFETLGQARQQILGNPGFAGSGNGQTTAGGYNFKLVNGKWVPA